MADLTTVLGGAFVASHHHKDYSASPTTIESVRHALTFVQAHELDSQDWLAVCMAIHSEYPNEAGFELCDSWSAQDPDRYDAANLRAKWRGFKSGRGVTIATLFNMAKQGGYRPQAAYTAPRIDPEVLAQQAMARAAQQAQADADKLAKAQAAALVAKGVWDAAKPCPVDHPYLVAKGVQAHGTRIDASGALIVPMTDLTTGALCCYQRITADGDKKFHGPSAGTGFLFGEVTEGNPLVICEGFSTSASAFEATGHAVLMAGSSGALKEAARAMHAKHPETIIIFGADDDYDKAINTGMVAAHEAAQTVNGLVAMPDFGTDRPDGANDFNDLHQLKGAGAVVACFDNAQKPLPKVKAGSPCTGTFFESAINLVAYTPTPTMANDQFLTWPEPTPLPTALPMVKAFDAQLLPEALRPWVMDIANRMQCPVDFPAVAALVALSGLIGARAVVQPKQHDDWQVVPVLWGMAIGRPGVKKSPSINEALKPLDKLQAEIAKQNKAEFDSWTMDARIEAMMAEANEKKAKALITKDPAAARALLEDTAAAGSAAQEKPPARRLTVNDATVEKLGEIMKENPWGLMAYRDELHGLLTSLDKQGQEGSRAFYLQAYDGDKGYTFDRIGRGTVYVPRVCLAMIGGIQPGKLQAYVRDAVSEGCADDGLLQRFSLAVWPDINPEYRYIDQRPDYEARQTAYAVFERLAALQPLNDLEPVVWRFDKAAQAIYAEWDAEANLENRIDDMHPAMVSHLSKYAKLIPALALVFAMIDTPDGDVIHETELVRALAFGEYLKSHATRIYQAAVTPETAGAAVLLQKIKDQRLDDGFTVREVVKKGWAGLNTPEAVRKAAAVLTSFDWLYCEVVQSPKGSRPSEQYRINPAALKAEKAA